MPKTLAQDIRQCRKCALCRAMPGTKPVPGHGPITAKIMLVGEALGEDESIIEQPFVGMCGRFLTNMLTKAGLDRGELYITNVVKCRPTDPSGKKNRAPDQFEIDACKGWLWKEIQLVKPKAIITLGKVPTTTLLSKKNILLKDEVGSSHKPSWFDTHIFPCYHPSYIMARARGKEDEAVKVFETVKEFVNVNS